MAIGMGVVLACEAITVAIGGQRAGIAAVFFVFLFEGCFTWGTSVCHGDLQECKTDICSVCTD